MKSAFILFFSFWVWALSAQTFSRYYDKNGQTEFTHNMCISKYGILLLSSYYCGPETGFCLGLFCLDPQTGDVLWERELWLESASRAVQQGQCIFTIDDSTAIIAGQREYNKFPDSVDIELLKISLIDGSIIWNQLYPAEVQAIIGSCGAPNGGYLWYGQVSDPAIGNKLRGFAMQTDAEGKEQWRRFFDSPYTNWVYSITVDSGGGYRYYRTEAWPYGKINTLGKMDEQGNTLWEIKSDSVRDYLGDAFIIGMKKGGVALGIQDDLKCPLIFFDYNCYPASVRRYDSEGQLLWKWLRHDDVYHRRLIRALIEKDNGDIIRGGYVIDSVGLNHAGLFALDEGGQLLWEKEYRYDLDPFRRFAIFSLALVAFNSCPTPVHACVQKTSQQRKRIWKRQAFLPVCTIS